MPQSSLLRTIAIQSSVLLIVAAQAYHGIIIQIQSIDYGISTLGLGVILSFFYVGYFVSCLITKRFIAAWGYIRGHALMTTIYGLAALLFPIYPGVLTWSVLYFICGIAIGGMFVVFEAWLHSATENKERGQMMALYMIMITLGKIIGIYSFNYVSTFSFTHYSYITMFILASMLPLLTTMLKQPNPVTSKFLPIATIYKISPAAFVVLLISQVGIASTTSLGAILGKLMGFNSWGISHLMSLLFIASIMTQMPVGNLSNKFDRRLVMLWMAVLMVIGNIFFLYSDIATPMFWLGMVIIGGTVFCFYPLAMAHFNDLLDENQRTSVASQLLLVAAIGQTVGPMTASIFIDQFSYKGYGILLVIQSVLILLFLLNRLRIRRPTPQDKTMIKFVPDLPMAPSVGQPIEPEPPKRSRKK